MSEMDKLLKVTRYMLIGAGVFLLFKLLYATIIFLMVMHKV